MNTDVQNTLKSIELLGELGADVVDFFQSKNSPLEMVKKGFEIGVSVKGLIESVPGSLPELKDLDAQEAALIGAAAYEAVRKTLASLAS